MSRPPDEPQKYQALKGPDADRQPDALSPSEPKRPVNHPSLTSQVAQLPGLGVSNEFVASERAKAATIKESISKTGDSVPNYVEIAKAANQKDSDKDRDLNHDTPEIDR